MAKKASLRNAAVVVGVTKVRADRVKANADGTFELWKTYFYTHGNTAEKWASKVREVFANVVDQGDHWASWPKTSYFWARVKVTIPEAVTALAEKILADAETTLAEFMEDYKVNSEGIR